MVFNSSLTAYSVPGGPAKRLFGGDRFKTAAAISREGWPSNSRYVILSTGEGDDKFADALAGAPISKVYNAPMLLTNTAELNSDTISEIRRLDPTNVIILGGIGVVSNGVEEQLAQMGLTVERLWGQDRYETAVKIAQKLFSQASFRRAILTTGEEFQYALVAAPFAENIPILFTQKDSLPQAVKDALVSLSIEKVEIIGSPNIVSESVKNEIAGMGITVERIGGSTPQQVNINVVRKYCPSPVKMALARDDLFADALTGSAFALKNKCPIFLVGTNSVEPGLAGYISTLSTTENYIFGGPDVVSDGTVQSLIHNRLGNIPSNLVNGGIAAVQGEWVYFTALNSLYKSGLDGRGLVKILDADPADPHGIQYINAAGDWIYYTYNFNIYKVKTDGTMKEKICDDADSIYVEGDWIYYSYVGTFHKIKTDGTGRVDIGAAWTKTFCLTIDGEWIYSILDGVGANAVFKMKKDGTEKQEIEMGHSHKICVQGEWIYYIDYYNDKLYKTRITSPSTETELVGSKVETMNVLGDWIYYTDAAEKTLHRIKTDGTGHMKLTDNVSSQPNIAGDWIYYYRDSALYRIKTDGTENKSVL